VTLNAIKTRFGHLVTLLHRDRTQSSSAPDITRLVTRGREKKESPLTINHLFAGIPVADYGSALAWYQRFFGRSPDVSVSENESMWRVVDNGWIYVVGDANHAGSALLTLLVDDLEDHLATLGERGLAPGAIETVPGLYRKAVMTDPDGNRISIGEDPSTHT